MNEVRNHAIIQETGIKIPKLLEVIQIDGKWAIVTEFIQGETLSHLMKDHPENKDMYIGMMIDLQLQFLALSGTRLNKMKDQIDRRICNSNLSATTRYHLHVALEEMLRDEVVCHGDYMPSNVILAEDGSLYIVDWSHAAQGNALVDVARTYLLFWMRGGIDNSKRYLDLFCKKTNIAKEKILAWMPIVAASEFTRCDEKEQEFLLSWINDIDL